MSWLNMEKVSNNVLPRLAEACNYYVLCLSLSPSAPSNKFYYLYACSFSAVILVSTCNELVSSSNLFLFFLQSQENEHKKVKSIANSGLFKGT